MMALAVKSTRPRLAGRSYRPRSESNVTPFVDVMLVLLVVFMITAPLLTVGVPVDLPEASSPLLQGQDEPLTITVDAGGTIFIQETEVALDDLVARLVAITDRKADTRIFLRGDQAIQYGRVVEVMATIGSAGFTKVALVAKSPSWVPRPKPRSSAGEGAGGAGNGGARN